MPSSQLTAVCSVDGQIISDHGVVCQCWAEYFGKLYQVDFPAVSLDTSGVAIPLPEPPISEEPPTLTEVREDISKLKGGKPIGICSIPANVPKVGDEPMALACMGLRAVLAAILHSGSNMDWIMGGATIKSQCGATLGNVKVTDLDFADDVLWNLWWQLLMYSAMR